MNYQTAYGFRISKSLVYVFSSHSKSGFYSVNYKQKVDDCKRLLLTIKHDYHVTIITNNQPSCSMMFHVFSSRQIVS